VARKGTQVAHHFAHPSDAVCKGETALHNVAKHIAARKLEKCIREGSAMRIKWECGNCHDYHLGDLAKTAATVEVEKALGPTRPDILLSDQTGAPRVAVEIVVTHAPEKSTVEFYRENKITLVTVNVKTTDDLEELRNSASLPVARVDACLRKKCTKCRKPLWERNMVIRSSECHKCKAKMPVATVEIEGIGGSHGHFDYGGMDGIQPSDREILDSAGVTLYRGRDGLLNCCPDCRYPVYPKSLHYHEWRWVQRTLPAGLYCDSCETVSYNRGPAVGGRLAKGCRHETQVTY
jgi:hypothetical protein